MKIEIIPADKYTIQELTDLYNQTRVDYLVPMPMSVDRLTEYINDFDVDLSRSAVAHVDSGQVLGLGMLGVRQGRAWITRLGVLPVTRRSGAGDALMDFMLKQVCEMSLEETHLEVIKDNEPAHRLFLKKNFLESGEYLVMRRAPHAISEPLEGEAKWLGWEEALDVLQTYPRHLTWINALDSMMNAQDVQGIRVCLPNGATGWMVFRSQKFFFSHLVMHTEQGDPVKVGTQLLRHLYSQNPRKDTYAENIHIRDPHLPAFRALTFFENFSRVEMRRCNGKKEIKNLS